MRQRPQYTYIRMADSSPVRRDLMCAILLAGAGFVATAVGGPALGVVGILAAGAAGNLFHDAIKGTRDWYAEWTIGPEGAARNFDITALAARAIRGIAEKAATDFTGHAHGRTMARTIADLTVEHWEAALRSPGFESLGDEQLLQLTGMPNGGIDAHSATGSVWADLIKAALLAAGPDAKIDTLTEEQIKGLVFVAVRLWERFPAQFNGELRNDPKHGGRALVAVTLLLANRTREEVAKVDEAVRTGNKNILDALEEATGRLRDRLKRLEEKHDAHEDAESARHAILHQQGAETQQIARATHSRIHAGPTLKPLKDPPGGPPGTLTHALTIDFMLRDKEMADLEAFLRGNQRVAWQLWYGGAGMGKTRLAFEFCRRIDRSWKPETSDWRAGFLDLQPGNTPDWSAWTPDHPTLIVVDYVEERTAELGLGIEQVTKAAVERSFHPVRFLLLERDNNADWFDTLKGGDDRGLWRSSAMRRDARGEPCPDRALAPFPTSDLASVVEAVFKVRAARNDPTSRAVHRPTPSDVAAKLDRKDFEPRPLFVMLAAAAAYDGADPATMSHLSLARDALQHELDMWRKNFDAGRAGEATFIKFTTLVALATLAEGLDATDGYRALHGRLGACNAGDFVPPADALTIKYDLLRKLYSLGGAEKPDHIPALRPDYLGELFVLDHIQRHVTSPAAQRALIRSGLTLRPDGVLAFLHRAVQSHPTHPTLRLLLEQALELCPEGGPAWPCVYGVGTVEQNLGLCAGVLNLTEMRWNFFDRAVAAPGVRPDLLVHVAAWCVRELKDRTRAAALLERLVMMPGVPAHDLSSAASLAAKKLQNDDLAERLLATLANHRNPEPDASAAAAGVAAYTLGKPELARTLLLRFPKDPIPGPQALADAAAIAAASAINHDLARKFLETLANHPAPEPHASAVAAGVAAYALKDYDLTRRLLLAFPKEPIPGPDSLANAAGAASADLKNHGLAEELLGEFEKHTNLAPKLLIQAARIALRLAGQQPMARRLFARVADDRSARLDDLILAAGVARRAPEMLDVASGFTDQAAALAVGKPVSLARVALLRWTIDQDEPGARRRFNEALAIRRAEWFVRAYFGLFFLCAKRFPEGEESVKGVLFASDANQRTRFLASVWLLAFAAGVGSDSAGALGQIKAILAAKPPFGSVLPVGVILEYLKPPDPAEQAWHKQLAAVITGHADVSALDKWEAWRNAVARPVGNSQHARARHSQRQ